LQAGTTGDAAQSAEQAVDAFLAVRRWHRTWSGADASIGIVGALASEDPLLFRQQPGLVV